MIVFTRPRLQVPVLVAGAVLTLALMPGCIFLAVRGVAAIDRKVDPPQKSLEASVPFFSGAVTATVRVSPIWRARQHGFLFDSYADEPPAPASAAAPETGGQASTGSATPPPKPVRLNLFVSLFNSSATTVQITVPSAKSALGDFAPQPAMVSLAPRQRAILEAMPCTSAGKIDKLEVTLILRQGDLTEIRKLSLVPVEPREPQA